MYYFFKIMPVCGLYIYIYLCVCVCVGGERYSRQLENSEYYVPFLQIHNTNQQVEDSDKFCNIPGDQLQLTKTPVAFMDLDDAFHICQARICSYLISLLWAEVKSFATY